ncbi:MAG: hypothetical protein SF162_06255 [bacterium]|nr:hypothetical protein [bacterium]
MEKSLTLLYTASLNGEIDALPRLYTALKLLRGRIESGRTIYVDAGGACSPDAWHCAVTGGRSMIVALDGMGCAVANVNEVLDPEAREKLGDNLALTLIDAAYPSHISDELIFAIAPPHGTDPDQLTILLAKGVTTYLRDRVLHLSDLRGASQFGMVNLEQIDGVWGLANYAIHDIAPATPPDPTIAGAVDFILSEARYARKRQAGDADTP